MIQLWNNHLNPTFISDKKKWEQEIEESPASVQTFFAVFVIIGLVQKIFDISLPR